jgi:COMPASS component SWD3
MEAVSKKVLPLSSDSYQRDQMEKLLKESKILKQRVETLEKENLALKKSIYDLSARFSTALHSGKPVPPPMVLGQDFDGVNPNFEEAIQTAAVVGGEGTGFFLLKLV